MEPVGLAFAGVGVDKPSEFDFEFKIRTHASGAEELTMWFCHGRRDSNFYIKHDGRVLATITTIEAEDPWVKPSPKPYTIQLVDPSVLNEDDMEIVMLKVAEGIAQRVQHLPTPEEKSQ